jgi:hypothetical protein
VLRIVGPVTIRTGTLEDWPYWVSSNESRAGTAPAWGQAEAVRAPVFLCGATDANQQYSALPLAPRHPFGCRRTRKPPVRARRALGARRRRPSALGHLIMDIADIGRECIQPTQVNQTLISPAIDIATCVFAATCSHYFSDQLESSLAHDSPPIPDSAAGFLESAGGDLKERNRQLANRGARRIAIY